jgi:hypothetical protein
MNKHFVIGGLALLCLIVCWQLTSRSTATADVDPGMQVAPPELRRLIEVSRPEYLELSRDEAIELLRSRDFDPDAPPQQEGPP